MGFSGLLRFARNGAVLVSRGDAESAEKKSPLSKGGFKTNLRGFATSRRMTAFGFHAKPRRMAAPQARHMSNRR
jgi:hypothetical protein